MAAVSSPVLLNPDTERLIMTYNKISGPIFGVINVTVFFLIMFDPDHRHTTYRRYLLVLQIVCGLLDAFLTITSPVVLGKFWIIYSVGIMPFGLSVGMGVVIFCFLVIEIVIAYSACAIYCHQKIIPKESPFRLKRWFYPFLALLNAWLLIFVPGIYYAITNLEYTDEELPHKLRWITTKKHFYAFHSDEDTIWILVGGGVIFSSPIYVIAVFVFFHMFYIIATGMRHVSPATRKTKIRAAVSILLQITVPSCVLVGPLGYNIAALLLRSDVIPVEVLACQFSCANAHAFLNSLTILLSSKYYMKSLAFPVMYCMHHTVSTIRDVIDPLSSSVAPSHESNTEGAAQADASPSPQQQESAHSGDQQPQPVVVAQQLP